SDPLANGHQNDAFDVFCILDHNGNQGEAVKAAARLLGIERESRAPSVREALEQFDQMLSGDEPPPSPAKQLPRSPSVEDVDADGDAEGDRGAGEGLTLAKALRRYALVEGTTHVWDIDKAMKMKKTAFVALVGQKVFKEWSEVTDEKKKKRISEEQVKEIERARSMA
ncbi:TPA: DNA primase, partial [Pseudomonas aeruginosa]|nr:DNA primase [Pseudomonas aeruginosa]HCF6192704.1 DNA primase [Pseudomonas aeruginosa]